MSKMKAAVRSYWNWSMAHGTWWGKSLALGAPVLIVLVLVSAVAGGGSEDGDASARSPAATPTRATVTGSPPAAPSSEPATISSRESPTAAPPTLEPTAVLPTAVPTAVPQTPVPVTYQVAQRQDVSFGVVVRTVFRVTVSRPLTESDLRRVTDELIKAETARRKVNAIGFFFYLPGTDTEDVFTAGKADWAPNGEWSDADTVKAGDYGKHRLGDITVGGCC